MNKFSNNLNSINNRMGNLSSNNWMNINNCCRNFKLYSKPNRNYWREKYNSKIIQNN